MDHELRTPVNHIIGFNELLQEGAEKLGVDEFICESQFFFHTDLIRYTFDLKNNLLLVNVLYFEKGLLPTLIMADKFNETLAKQMLFYHGKRPEYLPIRQSGNPTKYP